MQVWISEDFTGHWPVGTAAIAVAETEEDARARLDAACKESGLKGFDGTLRLISQAVSQAYVINNGDY